MRNLEDKRRIGTILSYELKYDGDHRYWTFWLCINFDQWPEQSFGGLCFDTKNKAMEFAAEVCDLFGKPASELAGLRCYGLWNSGELNEPMAGLETLDGRRFVVQAFRRKHWPQTLSARDAAAKAIKGTIASLEDRLGRERQRLAELDDDFVDWETEPLTEEAGKALKEMAAR